MVVPENWEEHFPEDDIRQFLMGFVDKGTISKYCIPDRFVVVEQYPILLLANPLKFFNGTAVTVVSADVLIFYLFCQF